MHNVIVVSAVAVKRGHNPSSNVYLPLVWYFIEDVCTFMSEFGGCQWVQLAWLISACCLCACVSAIKMHLLGSECWCIEKQRGHGNKILSDG